LPATSQASGHFRLVLKTPLQCHDLQSCHATLFHPTVPHQAAKTAFRRVKELDKKRKDGQAALGAQDWATAERLFIEALHVGAAACPEP
jgi:hypothetical protein